MRSRRCGIVALLVMTMLSAVMSFVPFTKQQQRHWRLESSSSSSSSSEQGIVSLTLDKPLGLILEEVEEGQPKGVLVQDIAPGGSAFTYKEQLIGARLHKVQGESVTSMMFEAVMETIIAAPASLTIDFITTSSDTTTETNIELDIGTPVTITVLQDGTSTKTLAAKVGDNLRTTLLANNVELYRGLKKKLGNCGGAGQCTFCAVKCSDLGEEWAPRSDYEETKIGKFKNARLACMTNIQGSATIEIQ